MILKSEPVHPFGLAVYSDYIFWTDWVRRAVQRANKHMGSDMRLLRVDIPQQPMGIIAVANDTNSCESGHGGAPSPLTPLLAPCMGGIYPCPSALGAAPSRCGGGLVPPTPSCLWWLCHLPPQPVPLLSPTLSKGGGLDGSVCQAWRDAGHPLAMYMTLHPLQVSCPHAV